MGFDISAIVTLHREGYMCKPSIESVKRAKAFAQKHGVNVEVILVFDKSDRLTEEVAKSLSVSTWGMYNVEFGDPGASRNFGVRQCSGKLVAFLDADDLWGENWLASCVSAARDSIKRIVWHPEVNIYFGAASHVFYHIDMESINFDLLDLSFGNLWTALCCAERDLLMEVPIPATDFANKIGHEDWSWNLQVIELGVLHKTIPYTGHAIRVKRGGVSQLQAANRANVVPTATYAYRRLLKLRVK